MSMSQLQYTDPHGRWNGDGIVRAADHAARALEAGLPPGIRSQLAKAYGCAAVDVEAFVATDGGAIAAATLGPADRHVARLAAKTGVDAAAINYALDVTERQHGAMTPVGRGLRTLAAASAAALAEQQVAHEFQRGYADFAEFAGMLDASVGSAPAPVPTYVPATPTVARRVTGRVIVGAAPGKASKDPEADARVAAITKEVTAEIMATLRSRQSGASTPKADDAAAVHAEYRRLLESA